MSEPDNALVFMQPTSEQDVTDLYLIAGGDDFDADGDGFSSEDYGGTDCEDSDADVVPDADGQCPLGVSCQDILSRDRSEGDFRQIHWGGGPIRAGRTVGESVCG